MTEGLPLNTITVDLPEEETIVLGTLPESYQRLIEDIGGRVSKDPQTVKITYTNPEGERLMINGDARYLEALEQYRGQSLSLSVIIVPVAAPGLESRLLNRMESGDLEFSDQDEEPDSDQYAEAKTKINEIVENSMHYLSPNFKKSLRTLLVSEVLDSGQVDLSDCSISSYECFLVSQLLPLIAGIRSLSFRQNLINDEGLATLCQILPSLRDLEQLDLSYNVITSASVPTLCESLNAVTGLTIVSLSFNQLTQDDFDNLLEKLPRSCKIMQHKTDKCVAF